MTPEGKVKAKAYKILKDRGIWYANQTADGGTAGGRPDCLACINGLFVGIEFKAGKNKPTKLQMLNMMRIRESGGLTLVVNEHNISHFNAILDNIVHYVRVSDAVYAVTQLYPQLVYQENIVHA